MKKAKRYTAALLAAVMVLSQGAVVNAVASTGEENNLTAFEQEFLSPNKDAKPFMRWWFAPGRMTEEEVRREIKAFADGGYSGVEVQSLELAKNCEINDETWNRDMKWILQAGLDYGVQIDCTIGQTWPIATPEIKDVDDIRAEQLLLNASADFTATSDAMTYHAESFVLPKQLDTKRDYELIAITAAKKLVDGSYDSSTALNLLDGNQEITFDQETGKMAWTAPSEGDWTVFYFYRQSANHMVGFGVDQYVIDHMSADATLAVTKNWEDAMNSDPELKRLYEENAGSLFGDSFELKSNLWTPKMLEEFQTRRGYDLTPYLPAINSNFSEIGDRVRDDLYTTMTELLAENHMGVFSEWAESHNMTLRYQAYSSAGRSMFELTEPALYTDIVEVESYAMSGTNPDSYRQLSAVPNMRGDQIFSAEAAEIGNDSWRETWTDTQLESGSDRRHLGFMHYAYRLFSAGVNKLVFHGATYKFTDTEDTFFPVKLTWPGYSAMSAMSYGNEWDDKTPMWENVDIMTDALSRTQMVLQQGQGNVDLAVYRCMYGKGNIQSDITPIEQAGYTYDYVTQAILNMDNAVVGNQNGKIVLAADGPSYKALVIEPMGNGTVPEMSLDVAEKILNYAKAGLPVVIVGEAPSKVNSYPGSNENVGSSELLADADAQLVAYMDELKGLDNVKTVADRAELVTALSQLEVSPDAQPETPSNMYYNHRTTEDAELYFMYNDDENELAETVTLKGEGTPYLLDPWSGEITPIAEFISSNGMVTINVDLDSQDAMMVAIAKDGWSSRTLENTVQQTNADSAVYNTDTDSLALRSTQGGDLNAVLSDGTTVNVTAEAAENPMVLTNWTMVLNQWTEGENVHDTNIVQSDTYDLSETGLVPWYEIDSNLKNVAGVAEYTTSFELEKGWEQGQGAYLDFTDVSDVGRLFVNGTEVPMNQISLHTDIGQYLVAGKNTIVVEVSSNMSNVMFGKTPDNTYNFGIIGNVTLTPYTQTKIVVSKADKGILNSMIAYAEQAKTSGEYDNAIESVQKTFDAALENAKAVANNAAATQEEVNAAWKTLMNEIHKLGFVAGDKTALASLIEAANGINAELDRYVEAGKAEFTAALEAAQNTYNNGDAMQAEINEVADNLLNAMLNLRFKADKSVLEDVLAEAGKVDANAYTAESYAALQAAVAEANDVYNNENATQEEVDTAVTNVQAAMDQLVAVDGSVSEETTPSTDDTATQTGQESTTKANAAKTGDTTPLAGAVAAVIAGAVLFTLRKKK